MNSKLIYNIYRKPTTSMNSIHFNSYSPNSHKWANFRYLLNRLNTFPLNKQDYNTELNTIRQIATHNNFSLQELHKLNNKIKKNIILKKNTTLNKHTPNKIQKWFPLTYRKNLSENIKSIFAKHNIHITHKIENKYKYDLLNKSNTPRNKMDCSGIYKLKCKCGACYIGRTTRKFKDRLKEHKHSFHYNYPENSKFSAHLLENFHPFSPDNESFEIIKASKICNLVNEQLPNFDNPLFKIRLNIT